MPVLENESEKRNPVYRHRDKRPLATRHGHAKAIATDVDFARLPLEMQVIWTRSADLVIEWRVVSLLPQLLPSKGRRFSPDGEDRKGALFLLRRDAGPAPIPGDGRT